MVGKARTCQSQLSNPHGRYQREYRPLTEEQLKYVYADEADLLNVALFGKTAAQWRKENPTLKGNIRDYATIEQLLVIANMESYNAILIEQGVPQTERLQRLNDMARSQLRVLQQIDTAHLLGNQ